MSTLKEADDDRAASLHRALRKRLAAAGAHQPDALRSLAQLRRATTGRFGDDIQASAALSRVVGIHSDAAWGPALQARLDDLMLVASIVARHRPPIPDLDVSTRLADSFGKNLRALSEDRRNGADRLMTLILKSEREDLGPHLRRGVALLATDERPLHVASLVRDLRRWSFEQRPVQRRWAYDYWWGASASHETGSTTDETPEGDE